jgi:hypothetical protein
LRDDRGIVRAAVASHHLGTAFQHLSQFNFHDR